jgi:hypothetical protein
MIILDNYLTVDEKILLDDKSFSSKIVADSYPETSVGVGCHLEGSLIGVYVKEKLLHLFYKNRIYSGESKIIKCTNKAVSQRERHFYLAFSENVICDFQYKRDVGPIYAFGDDEEDFDFLLYLSSLLGSKASIDQFIDSMSINL